jgi:hypothetical protein
VHSCDRHMGIGMLLRGSLDCNNKNIEGETNMRLLLGQEEIEPIQPYHSHGQKRHKTHSGFVQRPPRSKKQQHSNWETIQSFVTRFHPEHDYKSGRWRRAAHFGELPFTHTSPCAWEKLAIPNRTENRSNSVTAPRRLARRNLPKTAMVPKRVKMLFIKARLQTLPKLPSAAPFFFTTHDRHIRRRNSYHRILS